MRMRKAIQKMAAITTGLTMVGATIFGAAAASLADYPSPLFIKDGKFDGIIVVGAKAASSDVIGSIDIATALQAESVVTTAGPSQGAGLYKGGLGRVSVVGDVAEISEPNDLLEINENLGSVRETMTELDLNALKGGVVTTDEGTTNYNQYLRFAETGEFAFNTSLATVYQQDEDDNVGDFLFGASRRNNPMFEYELEFEEGAESSVESTRRLRDLEDEIFNVLGTPMAVASTDIDTGQGVLSLKLLGGAVSDILEEGETKTYTINGKEYETNVLIVSDNLNIVKFKINGEITRQLRDGEVTVLKDGTRVGIREILPNEAEEVTGGDLVEFYLGATQVEFTDNFNNSNRNYTRNVRVNDETIEDGQVAIIGRLFSSNSKFEILSMKYRLDADTLIGDLYVPPGHGVREYLEKPEGMLSPNWDVVYGGLVDTGTSILKFNAKANDAYNVLFTSQEGLNYKFDYLDNDAATGLRIGDDNQNLYWIEAGNQTDYHIHPRDVFVLTDKNDETGFTHVVEYQNFNEGDDLVVMTDLAGQTRQFTATNNRSNLVFGGNTFLAFVGPTPDFNITVDLNHDGAIGDRTNTVTNTQCGAPLVDIIGLSINRTGGLLSAATTISTATSNGDVGPCRAAVVVQGGGVLDLGVCDGRRPPGHVSDASDTLGGGTTPANKTTCQANFNANATGKNDISGSLAPEFSLVGGNSSLNTIFQVGLKTLGSEFDENGPRALGGDEVVLVGFENRTNYKLGLSVREPQSRFGSTATPPGIRAREIKENNDILRGMTDYGVLVELFNPSGSDQAEDLTVEYPLVQRGAHVFVVSGEYGISKSGAGESQQVQRINVGAAKLDTEVEDISAVNAIVVGGPCANSASAALMGNPEDCVAGFEPGKAIIKLFENKGHVALLVAGYDALDTRRAARVLANHADYPLSGDEVVVTGTSLTDISVKAVKP